LWKYVVCGIKSNNKLNVVGRNVNEEEVGWMDGMMESGGEQG
jgi:hypothetical protein